MSNSVSRYSDQELGEFKELIEKKLSKSKNELEDLQQQILEITENSGDDFGIDWVDDSSTSSDLDMLNDMAIRQRKYIKDLENALIRIQNKTYGICVISGELIDKKRLMAVPTTTKSLAAKMAQQNPVKPSRVREQDDDDDDDQSKSKPKKKDKKEPKIISKVIRKSNTTSSPEKKDIGDDLDFDEEENEFIESDSEDYIDLDSIADDSDGFDD